MTHLHAVAEGEHATSEARAELDVIAEAMVSARRAAKSPLLSDQAKRAASSLADSLAWTLHRRRVSR